MSNIVLSSEELFNASRSLKAMEEEVNGIFQGIRSDMNRLNSFWNSPAANALQENFAMLSPAFDQYIDQLDRFVLFLSSTAQAYQENESVLGLSLIHI